MQLQKVEAPNVLHLEFDEDVFLVQEKGISHENLVVKISGPKKKYPFKWRILNEEDMKPNTPIKRIELSLYDFQVSLEGGGKEVTSALLMRFRQPLWSSSTCPC